MTYYIITSKDYGFTSSVPQVAYTSRTSAEAALPDGSLYVAEMHGVDECAGAAVVYATVGRIYGSDEKDDEFCEPGWCYPTRISPDNVAWEVRP
jgi:hypothetical protein